jgi:baculoviral IAP repeat-containing protein 5
MAQAGWYSCGGTAEPDLAQCFVCGKQLDGWEGDDDPWMEHRKHKADCPFVKLGKKEEDLTLFELIKINLVVEEATLIRLHNEQVERLRTVFKEKKALVKKKGMPLKVKNMKTEKM